MFRYSISPFGDEIVQKDIDRISLSSFGKSRKANGLILFGAFGRGEGLVLNGVPRNDYDLLLVNGTIQEKGQIEELELKCFPEVHLVSESDINNAIPTQQWFEIKYASQRLWGDFIPMEHLPDWEPYEIPFGDAINSLERRAVSMIIAKYEMGKEKPDFRKVTEQIAKMQIALGDAILIKRGQFHPKYAIRNLMLQGDTIGPDYNLAVSTKITGSPELNPDQQWAWWQQCRNRFREYINENQIKLVIGDALEAITDRVTQEQLADLIKKLGAEKWM